MKHRERDAPRPRRVPLPGGMGPDRTREAMITTPRRRALLLLALLVPLTYACSDDGELPVLDVVLERNGRWKLMNYRD